MCLSYREGLSVIKSGLGPCVRLVWTMATVRPTILCGARTAGSPAGLGPRGAASSKMTPPSRCSSRPTGRSRAPAISTATATATSCCGGTMAGSRSGSVLPPATSPTTARIRRCSSRSTGRSSAPATSRATADWKISSIADFNGDGREDILLRNDSGWMTDWLGTATGSFANNGANLSTFIAPNWVVQDPFM